MSTVWQFLSRRAGPPGRLSLTDVLSYAYLVLGFLVILLPVIWIGINSLKSQAQLERQDLSLLPSEYAQVGRATLFDQSGKQIFVIGGLPDWVLNWRSLNDEQRADYDPSAFLSGFTGADYRVLRSHLGLVSTEARALIQTQGLPEWLLSYPTMTAAQQARQDVEPILQGLPTDQQRLLSEFLSFGAYQPHRLIAQIKVTAPDPVNGQMREWAVPSLKGSRPVVAARAVDDPTGTVVRLPKDSLTVERALAPAYGNYSEPLLGKAYSITVDFMGCLTNSVVATLIATVLTLLINSMAAFALSKYRFRGQTLFFVIILATLMVPPTITLVGVFKMIDATGLSGSIWGVIIPGAATPAGVFLLRQYMLTIPDELIEAARMDAASEWKIYWRIMLPLALPAIAALGILSVIWRWNDLILPMVAVATTKEAYTLQLCLLEFRGEHLSQEHYRLAMTVVSLIPTTLVFVFLQRYITTGIANSGVK